jgi:NAD(P)-dependent dehydrogenase (short-subunit alcohol dehydrogenase family)
MSERLKGKVCLITGTGGSMGRAAALRFAGEGATVVGCDINAERDAETRDAVRAAGGVMDILTPTDLTKKADCQALIDFAIDRFERIDVLYNNAAMAYFAWMDEIEDDVWYKTIDQELNLVFLLTRAAWPHLKASKASIINVASVCGMISFATHPAIAHSAAKGGVIAMTKQFALEGRKHGIRANSISPGLVETTQTVPLLKDREWAGPMLDKIMMDRFGKPEEIAAAAVFFASDDSSYVTGVNLPVDGGMTAW